MNRVSLDGHERANLDRALASGLTALGLTMDSLQTGKLLQYISLICKWNRIHNLTAIRDTAKMVSHHILDSLAILPFITGPKVLDVGTGAGLPGIPLAIARPNIELTLIDSNSKKIAFLQQARADLKLDNVQPVCARVEGWSAGPFDTIVSRAYSELKLFVLSSQHLLASGGVFAAMKGAFPEAEMTDLPETFRVRQVHRLEVPGLDAERHLVMIEKA